MINKPVGMTSFQVVARVRKLLGTKKAGHCGTLDPFAQGLLPICTNRATRIIRYMDNYDKGYRCRLRFGAFTDTQDCEGTVVGGRKPTKQELEDLRQDDFATLRQLFDDLIGKHIQIPPMYSAVKVAGRPLYDYARKGITLERQGRNIEIYSCDIHEIVCDEELEIEFSVRCSKGTYIRTICDDLGQQTGWGAYALTLVRESCGPFNLTEACSLEVLEKAVFNNSAVQYCLPEEVAISHLPTIELTLEEAEAVKLGQIMPYSQVKDRLPQINQDDLEPRFRAYHKAKLIAIMYVGNRDSQLVFRIERMLA